MGLPNVKGTVLLAASIGCSLSKLLVVACGGQGYHHVERDILRQPKIFRRLVGGRCVGLCLQRVKFTSQVNKLSFICSCIV